MNPLANTLLILLSRVYQASGIKNSLRCPRACAADMPHMICFSGLDYNSKHGATYSTLWSLINCQKCIVEGMMDYSKENINEARCRQPMWRPELMSLPAWEVHSFWFPKPGAESECQSHPIKSSLAAPFSLTVMIKVIFAFVSSRDCGSEHWLEEFLTLSCQSSLRAEPEWGNNSAWPFPHPGESGSASFCGAGSS